MLVQLQVSSGHTSFLCFQCAPSALAAPSQWGPPLTFGEASILFSWRLHYFAFLSTECHQTSYSTFSPAALCLFFFLTVKTYLRGGITLPQGIFSVVSCSWCCLLPWHCRMTEGRDITLTSSSYAHVLKALQSSEQTHSAVVLLKLRISTEYPHADLHKSKTGSESCFRTGWESV